MSRNNTQMSIWTVLVFTVCWTHITGCNNTNPLPNMIGRSRADLVDANSIRWIHDFYISSGWYNVTVNGFQYHMPGSDHIPDQNACGTHKPIYLKANRADFDNLNNNGTETSRKVCILTESSRCEEDRDIMVRKCGTEIQYFLEPTNRLEAYCFDPPNLQGKDMIAYPKDVDVGNITVKPSLEFNGTTPFSVFNCNFTTYFTTKPYLYYTITWTITGQLHKTKLLPDRTDHAIWNGYELPRPFTVFIDSNIKQATRHRRVDPHMKTANGSLKDTDASHKRDSFILLCLYVVSSCAVLYRFGNWSLAITKGPQRRRNPPPRRYV